MTDQEPQLAERAVSPLPPTADSDDRSPPTTPSPNTEFMETGPEQTADNGRLQCPHQQYLTLTIDGIHYAEEYRHPTLAGIGTLTLQNQADIHPQNGDPIMSGVTRLLTVTTSQLPPVPWIKPLPDGLDLRITNDAVVVRGEWTVMITITDSKPPPELLDFVFHLRSQLRNQTIFDATLEST